MDFIGRLQVSAPYASLEAAQRIELHKLIALARQSDTEAYRDKILPHVLALFEASSDDPVAKTCMHLAEHGSFFVHVCNEGATLDTFSYDGLPDEAVAANIKRIILDTLASEVELGPIEPDCTLKLVGVGQVKFDTSGHMVLDYCDQTWSEFTDRFQAAAAEHSSLEAFVESLSRKPDRAWTEGGQYIAEFIDKSEAPLPHEIDYIWNQHKQNTLYDIAADKPLPRQGVATGAGRFTLLTCKAPRLSFSSFSFRVVSSQSWSEAAEEHGDRPLLWSHDGGISDPLEIMQPLSHIHAQPIAPDEVDGLAAALGARWGAQYYLQHFDPHPVDLPCRQAELWEEGTGGPLLVSWSVESGGAQLACFVCFSADDWVAARARIEARLAEGAIDIEVDDHREVTYTTWEDVSADLHIQPLTDTQAAVIRRFFQGGRLGNVVPLFG